MDRNSIQVSDLAGYDNKLETQRSEKFRQFILAETSAERVRLWKEVRDLTAQRSALFIRDLEQLYGIPVDEEAANDEQE